MDAFAGVAPIDLAQNRFLGRAARLGIPAARGE